MWRKSKLSRSLLLNFFKWFLKLFTFCGYIFFLNLHFIYFPNLKNSIFQTFTNPFSFDLFFYYVYHCLKCSVESLQSKHGWGGKLEWKIFSYGFSWIFFNLLDGPTGRLDSKPCHWESWFLKSFTHLINILEGWSIFQITQRFPKNDYF